MLVEPHLRPASRVLTAPVAGVRHERHSAATPCGDTGLGDLLDHVDGFALPFAAAATQAAAAGGPGPRADGSRLGGDGRTRIPQHLAALAVAWGEEAAWRRTADVVGQPVPGEPAGVIALDELIVHGRDVAVAGGRPSRDEPASVEDASLVEQLLARTGRDPTWRGGRA
ncbi:MAG TPA: TIGR03086 family metal-binding protein [Acidimicrobiales bacterium]|nr:TIGR03086 family metal-binding protein [Acidimicrobiales bacterium]